jgi:hypothetical protein
MGRFPLVKFVGLLVFEAFGTVELFKVDDGKALTPLTELAEKTCSLVKTK